MATKDFSSLLTRLHLDDQSISNYLSSSEVCETILHALKLALPNVSEDKLLNEQVFGDVAGRLLVQLALTKKITDTTITEISKYILSDELKNGTQLNAAVTFFAKNDPTKYEVGKFKESTGIGIEVTEKEIDDAVDKFIQDRKDALVRDRYLTKVGALLGQLSGQGRLKWANKPLIKSKLDEKLLALWGPETEEDKLAAKNASKGTKEKVETKSEQPKKEIKISSDFEARHIPDAVNPPELLKKHLEITGGKVMTRFPPEPNGFLHIGHAKAINLSFTHANKNGGNCYLRYDDTNPTKEEDVYFKSILEMVEWLGFKPWKVTYSSEYFEEMYQFAIVLIKKGLAYVDFQDKETINNQRKEGIESPYRNTSIEVNLRRFNDMKNGRYAEGEAVLRCKIDMKSNYFSMRDFVAYRIMYVPHPHVGGGWCIYPTYDYTHCIVDSLENITHSLCTLEFEVRRDSYYWLLAALDLYRPHVWEFSRLNVSTSLLSKRKINLLVAKKLVRNWNDPRLLTLAGLRRRGYTREAILNFCAEVGVTRSENLISILKLEAECRKDLDERSDRAFAILRPLKVVLTNFDADRIEYHDAPFHPKDSSRGTRKLPLTKILYIDQNDFKVKDESGYFGLAPGKTVGLRYGPVIKCTSFKKGSNGEVSEIECEVIERPEQKVHYIHWLAQPKPGVDPESAEFRIYDYLFNVPEDPKDLAEYLPPEKVEDFLKAINPNSEIVYKGFLDPVYKEKNDLRQVYSHVQFERVGFFVVDEDSTQNDLVFNLTIGLGGKKVKGKPNKSK